MILKRKEDLETFNDLFHDEFFNVDEIIYDKDKGHLILPFFKLDYDKAVVIKKILFLKKKRIPLVKYEISFSNVISYKLFDTEKIGLYDFNVISYLEKEGLLKIISSIPLELEINVSSLEIEISLINEINEFKIKYIL
ncbi:MAG: hypothetical protein HYS25_04780 [Ignavibacteriales bacterium]|nr:hypothetical protein [Ignavibacteriales bacterium]